jgi:hypothetical protein
MLLESFAAQRQTEVRRTFRRPTELLRRDHQL